MKFVVENLTKCAPRLGVLNDIEKAVGCALETPLALLYTRGGSIPHITHEVFKIICTQPQIIQIPLVTTYHYHDVLEGYEGNISDFVGLKDCLTCMTVQDPGDLTQPGHHKKNAIPLWTRHGKVNLTADDYMNTVEAFQPDMYYFMSDGDTNTKSSSGRVSRSVEKTVNFFAACLKRHQASKVLRNAFPMGVIAGGYSVQARQKCIDAIGGNSVVQGFLIDGLHNNGPEVEFIPFNETKAIVAYVINNLPSEKLRVLQGCWNPMVAIKMIQLGVDVLDTSYCNLVTERSSALVFSYETNDVNLRHVYEINLRQTRFAYEFAPLVQDCECLTCRQHTRAYIHHLITVQELLGPLLLTIHNNHHYMKFFEKIRKCIKDGTLDALELVVERQFVQNQQSMFEEPQTEIAETIP